MWIKTVIASFVAQLHISYFNPGDLNFKGKLSLGEKQSTGIESTAKPHSWFYTHDTAHMLYRNSQELILMSGSYSWQIPVTHHSVECKMWWHIVHSVCQAHMKLWGKLKWCKLQRKCKNNKLSFLSWFDKQHNIQYHWQDSVPLYSFHTWKGFAFGFNTQFLVL